MLSSSNIVIIKNNQPVTTSRLIAEKFGKRHSHVIRDIRNLECSEEFRQSNFGPSSYISSQNKEMIEYIITRDGFTFLVMGFTGKQAAKFKEDYINAFNQMEQQLKAQVQPASQIDILVQSALALQAQEKRLQQVEQHQHTTDEKIKMLEAKTTTRPSYFTIAGYATLNGISVNVKIASRLGKAASRLCKQKGLPTDRVKDPRFGLVNSYPESVLKEIFETHTIN